jgi:hypothetical protein
MHPTADTMVVININGLGRRVMPGVMPPLRASAKWLAASAPLNAAEVKDILAARARLPFCGGPLFFDGRARAAAMMRSAITSACTRPPTRRLLNSYTGRGGA